MLFILILTGSLLLQFLLPWWIIGPVAFGLSFWKARSGSHAFGAGFSAILVLWIAMGLFKTLPNNNLLANRVAQLLGLPDLSFNWILMLVITGLIGGLAAGFSALAGYHCKNTATK